MISIVLFLFVTNTFAQNDTVYYDNLYNNWHEGDWGNNNNDVASTTSPYSGSYCIEIEYTDWGYFGFDHRHVNWVEIYYYYPNQYKYLNFYYNPGSDASSAANVAVTLDKDESVKIVDYIAGTITANTWYNVRIPLADMNPLNDRFYRVYFGNESGSLTPTIYLDDIYLEWVEDDDPPVISNVLVSDIEQNAATVSWNTDEPVIYTFKYRLEESTGAYTKITTDVYQPGGEVELTELLPDTTYQFIIICEDHQRDPDSAANVSSDTNTFKTTALDVNKPVISNLRIINVYRNRVVIGWETDELANTQVDFGVGNYNSTYVDELYTKKHTVVLTHIDPSTEYQYRVTSEDRFDNDTTIEGSPAMTFTTEADDGGPLKWIVTDHPIYDWDEATPDEVPWDKITHLNLGQLWPVPSDSGYTLGIEPDSWWSDDWGGWARWSVEARAYVDSGHAANRKVICMLGGAGSNPDGQWNTATSSENVVTFTGNIRKVLESIGFDGTDIDWEDDIDFPSFERLARTLDSIWPTGIITIPAGFIGNDAVDFVPCEPYVDAFMPMSYYPVPQWGGWTLPVPITPIYSVGANEYGIEDILGKWTSAGVPASKMIMGVGGFGSVWGDSNDDGLAPVRPNVNDGYPNGESRPMGGDNVVTWTWVHTILEENPKTMSEAWDAVSECTYWHTKDSATQIPVIHPNWGTTMDISLLFYESARSMSNKVEYIEENKMKGVGYWTLVQLINDDESPVLDVASCLRIDTTTNATENPEEPIKSNHYCANIYVNSREGKIFVNNMDPNVVSKIALYDVSGRILLQQNLLNQNNIIQMPENKGVYIVVLRDRSGKFIDSKKVIRF